MSTDYSITYCNIGKNVNLPMSEIKSKAWKYSLLLCVSSLFFELFLKFQRRSLILNSLKNNECVYELDIEDLELL